MSLDYLFAQVSSHEMRIEQKKGKVNVDVIHNLTAIIAQKN